ncbi:hypothetical protein GCM10011514_39690 [Emticicia aquatilis]|uniref:Uncharacterized protein n=2 Tax=Emticicia aquatilis TaxID=1537369 RepID=A0A916Z2N1_9BACT|nr:hypothetical protein GCM10011514_39690 [Emticicia aquatilis]
MAWYNLDKLLPIDYVEGIVQLANKISFTYQLLAVLSLVLLLFPFFFYHKETLAVALGTYYAFLLIATIFGNFPVMIMGYGVSPIIGYSIGLFRIIAQMEDNKQI